jgi:hypothetical protein
MERYKVAMMAKAKDAPEPEGKPKVQWSIPARHFLYDTFVKPEVWEHFLNRTFEAMELAADELRSGA